MDAAPRDVRVRACVCAGGAASGSGMVSGPATLRPSVLLRAVVRPAAFQDTNLILPGLCQIPYT